MKILFLPGANPETQELAHNLLSTMPGLTVELSVVDYQFWQKGIEPNLEYELEHIFNVFSFQQYDLILAKSIGCLVLLEAAYRNILSFKKAALMGAPLSLADKIGLNPDALSLLKQERFSCIHQQNDQVCPASYLQQFSIQNLYQIPGKDHLYTDFESYRTFIETIIKQVTRENLHAI